MNFFSHLCCTSGIKNCPLFLLKRFFCKGYNEFTESESVENFFQFFTVQFLFILKYIDLF